MSILIIAHSNESLLWASCIGFCTHLCVYGKSEQAIWTNLCWAGATACNGPYLGYNFNFFMRTFYDWNCYKASFIFGKFCSNKNLKCLHTLEHKTFLILKSTFWWKQNKTQDFRNSPGLSISNMFSGKMMKWKHWCVTASLCDERYQNIPDTPSSSRNVMVMMTNCLLLSHHNPHCVTRPSLASIKYPIEAVGKVFTLRTPRH